MSCYSHINRDIQFKGITGDNPLGGRRIIAGDHEKYETISLFRIGKMNDWRDSRNAQRALASLTALTRFYLDWRIFFGTPSFFSTYVIITFRYNTCNDKKCIDRSTWSIFSEKLWYRGFVKRESCVPLNLDLPPSDQYGQVQYHRALNSVSHTVIDA